jgi:hypothetical protein
MGWIGGALAIGTLVVLAPPILLFWKAVQPEPLDANALRIRFQTVRYEAGGLVFRYLVQNLAHTTARFVPEGTQVRALQPPDRPPVGYANVKLPLELPPGSVQEVELRLELPATLLSMWQTQSDEQTKQVLQHKAPGSPVDVDAGSPLPMRGPIAANENLRPAQPNFSLEDSLTDLQGFELSDPTRGIRLVFPRGW